MIRTQGYGPALASLLLVSTGQLGMRWGMSRLPPLAQWLDTALAPTPLLVVALAVLAYVTSLLCWLIALRHLPLARAYSLLSLSYALVYLLAAGLPAFGEPLTLGKSVGVGLIVVGVWTINSPRTTA